MQNSCIFCAIVKEKIPAYRIYEDDLFLGFLDIHPRVLGHTLLIPKKHYLWVYDVPEFKSYWQAVLKITTGMQKTLLPRFITYMTHGLEVPHAHIHILPRRANETEINPPPQFIRAEKMKYTADLLRSKLIP
ncbi:MAG TPA: HIT domain-containing protein [Patescibacteria group bacterium]|nr:HIT domain-containing protein [Patescibacteria group bacterium]